MQKTIEKKKEVEKKEKYDFSLLRKEVDDLISKDSTQLAINERLHR